MKTVFVYLLTVLAAVAQTAPVSVYTNAPLDVRSTVLDPQAMTPAVIVPAPVTVTIPSGLTTAPPPPTNSPFRWANGVAPVTARDLATHAIQMVAPPLPPLVSPTSESPAPTNSEPTTLTGGQFRYVAMTGTDSNDGTKNQPWKSIQRAAEAAQPGDVVVVRPGSYEAFHTVHGGTAKQPLTFRADGDVLILPPGGQSPVGLQPQTLADYYRLDNIHIRQTDYVIIDGFRIQAAGRCGIFVVDSRGVILRNNVIGPVGVFGILTGFAQDVQIISNKTFGAVGQHGIYVSNSRVTNDNPIIAFNETFDNHQNGIQVNGDCNAGGDGNITGALIEGNVVHDNGMKGLSLISMSDSVVRNNLIYNNGKLAGAAGIHLTDELGCGHPSSGNVVVNNTVVEPRMAGIRLTDGAHGNIIFNNLLIGPHPLVDEVNDNQIDPDSNLQLDSVVGVFNNSDGGDYRLLITSPARNAGVASYQDQRAPVFDREGHRRHAVLGVNVGAY